MTTYAASEVRALLARGPSEGEDFYRLKVTGNGETKWVNVSPDQLGAIARIADEPRRPMNLESLAAFAREELGGDPTEVADWQQVAEALYHELVATRAVEVSVAVWRDEEGFLNAQAYRTREGAERDFRGLGEGPAVSIVRSTVQP